ncbi:hypothetical protein [Deinococcus petrolearius]|uniref:Uncharacterized protein n=1 Tax=Deinococcus petrolearius TaxID=1751295 RepID=A0ABW1DPI4_9DEIO
MTDRYVKLSDEVKRLDLPQQSETFVRKLRSAIAEEIVEGVYNGEKFVLPKQFTDLTRTETRQKKAKEMLILYSPAYEAWFLETQAALTQIRPRSEPRLPITPENFTEGKLDWQSHLDQTRHNIQNKQERGAKLGLMRQEKKGGRRKKAPALTGTSR